MPWDKDPEHPALDMVINTEFFYDENKDNTATILLAREIRQRFHKNGDIYDYKKSNMKYGYDITGELIKMDTKAKELFEGDRGDIVPRMKVDDNGDYIVRYVSMAAPQHVHMIETYALDGDTFILKHISNPDQGVEIDFEWLPEGPGLLKKAFPEGCYKYVTTYKHEDMECIVEGYINRPNSGDMFMYTTTKKGLSFSKSPYFQNIYAGEADGSYFLTNNIIDEAIIKNENWTLKYRYEYTENGVPRFSCVAENDGEWREISESTNMMELEGVGIIYETCFPADPVDKPNKKTVMYIASVLDPETKELLQQYRALIVND